MALAGNADLNSALGGAPTPGTPATSSDYDQFVSAEKDRAQKLQAKAEELSSDLDKGAAERKAASFDFQKSVQETEKQLKQPMPVEQDRSPMEALGSSASMLAIFGSLLTRRPFVNAMNAAAGVMNAYKAQDQHAFDKQLEAYKLNMDNAKALYQLQRDAYQSILQDSELSEKDKIAKWNAYAAAFKDETTPLLASMKEREQQFRWQMSEADKNRAADERFRIEMLRLQESQNRTPPATQAYNDFMRANPNASPAEQAQFIQSFRTGTLPSPGMPEDMTNQAIPENDILAATGLSQEGFLSLTGQNKRMPNNAAIKARAAQEAQDFAARNNIDTSLLPSQFSAISTNIEKNLLRKNQVEYAESEILATIDNLKPAADKVASGDIRKADVLNLWAGKEVNNPDVAEYGLYLNQLREEMAGYNAALQGRGAGMGGNAGVRESDYEQAEKTIWDGLNTKAASGIERAVKNSTKKMEPVLQAGIDRAHKQIWEMLGVGGKYKGGAAKPAAGPEIGTVEDGFKFKGGDPSKPENWEKQ